MLKQKEREIQEAKVRAQQTAGSLKDGSANASKPTTSPSQQSSYPSSTRSQPPGSQKSSAARDDWESQKKLMGEHNDAIDRTPANKKHLNLALLRNPRTGGKTVARLYAQFLESIQVLLGNVFKEITGASLAHDGVGGAKKLIEDVMKGGSGTDVLDFLLAEMENRAGSLVFILAGYSRQMEKFFSHNPGLPSCVPHRFTFEGYADEELLDMLANMVEKQYGGRILYNIR
ncbi:uncharacterized protein F5147DRAFT_778812 [Suillus discolor]|uniref:Uncharacterized protein n=1 Tax=Suillus discolor TaxID=1912936 RepID=A0A9P7EWP2_9AGAM|nr:uncharacterized protein F5147DRAFT_778812 [Suillus discolor]KAG2095117.1 hypothetical protein F5147DRAFT_778812 [Suillus discolor]